MAASLSLYPARNLQLLSKACKFLPDTIDLKASPRCDLSICCRAEAALAPAAGAGAPPAPALPTARKPRIVVLGSGWGAVSFIKNVRPEAFGRESGGRADGPYELVVISPRNYFAYTPLIPAAAAGTIEERSIVEPIRELLAGKGSFVEASVTRVDAARQTLRCKRQHCDVCDNRGKAATCGDCQRYETEFDVSYDALILSVGARVNTFGIKGVKEHAFFLRSIEDAKKLRTHIRQGGHAPGQPFPRTLSNPSSRPLLPCSKMVERASTPTCTPEERRRLLSIVVVGGGPTGVEAAAELQDLMREDIARLLPHLEERPIVTLVANTDVVLKTFSPSVGVHATAHLQRRQAHAKGGVRLLMGHAVTAIAEGNMTVKQLADNSEAQLPFGTCIWGAGITAHPLVAALREHLPAEDQTARRGLLVDGHLRVRGAPSIFALGDAAATAEAPADQLPATAQVARQQAEYLAGLFNSGAVSVDEAAAPAAPCDPAACASCTSWVESEAPPCSVGAAAVPSGAQSLVRLPDTAKPFKYTHLGQLAYIGAGSGIVDLPLPGIVPPAARAVKGALASLAWRGMESWMQVSLRNQVMVISDMVRTKLFGRNISAI
eukprot:scaffold11.g3955.t1